VADRSVKIPDELYSELEGLLPRLGMNSVDECVAYILRSLLSGRFDSDELSGAEEEQMRERLADLGYM
jgi:metal-responsive CopG/Arc/MetJ family transcriptional regulator